MCFVAINKFCDFDERLFMVKSQIGFERLLERIVPKSAEATTLIFPVKIFAAFADFKKDEQ